jgi:hypothetical protein
MKDLASSFLKFPTKIALGMFGGVSTLLAWHPEWQKAAPQIEEQILSKQKEQQERKELKQDKILDSMEKAANKPTIDKFYNTGTYNDNSGAIFTPAITSNDKEQQKLIDENND